MKHQLVLQFQGEDSDTLDKVIALEDQLIEALDGSNASEVDGHDTSGGFTNLLIDTNNAVKLWEKIEPLVEDAASDDLELNAVAFRPLDGEEYTVLWPADFDGDFEIE